MKYHPTAAGINDSCCWRTGAYLGLALLLAIVVGRRLRSANELLTKVDLVDEPYTLHVEPLTQAEIDAMWARIKAAIAEERQDAA